MASRRGLPSHLRRFGVIHVIIGLVAVVVIGGLLALDFSHRRAINVGTAQAWDIQGAPCPTATPQEWAATHQIAPKTFDYTGDVLGRVAGDASCSDVQDKGGKGLGVIKVCQFTSPAALTVKTKADYIFEPEKEKLLEELVPKILNTQLFKALCDTNASEHGARMVAMDSATNNANELIRSLKILYNRERQAAITKEILEIVGGAAALEDK